MNWNISCTRWMLLLLVMVLIACGSQVKETEHNASSNGPDRIAHSRTQNRLDFISPTSGFTTTIGQAVDMELVLKEEAQGMDSIRILADGMRLTTIQNGPLKYTWNTVGWQPGQKNIHAELYAAGSLISRSTISIVLYSDIVPVTLKCRVLKIYPHDRQAYTQGLIMDQGFLYESTGVRGKSSLRKIDLESGTLLASLNLPPDLFGEGITVFDDKIIQLTWTSGYGFIYDKNSFKFLRKVHYGTQGWGITFDGEHLIMSDGSHQLIFMETDNFREVNRISVFDHQGPVENLNELEYVHGKIYANIYTTDRIAIIDPATGKVRNYIDCTGLLDENDQNQDTDVLNGIAYDTESERLFVTGKNWPKLFEIMILDQ